MMDQQDGSAVAVVDQAAPQTKRKPEPKILPPYNVVLHDDNDHTYEYVVRMLMALFAHPLEAAFQMACEVDTTGRVIVDTTTKERAELKRDQIHAYGRDRLVDRCQGSMSATIEPCVG